MQIQALFYGYDMARMFNGILSELPIGDIDVEIRTYVRNDYSDDSYRVDSANTMTSEKRTNVFLESNRAELEKNQWLSDGYSHVDINTSDGLSKSLSSANHGIFLDDNTFRIVTGESRKSGRIFPHLSTILSILKLFTGERIWTLTCDGRRARCGFLIGKWSLWVSLPLIQINCITDRIQ